MVAETLALPNVRKMFIPDPGYVMFDVDLERADAQVVAWDAGDEKLKAMFREGADIHTENARDIFRIKGAVPYELRQKAKAGVHATNYGTGAKTLAAALGCTVKEAEDFIRRWMSAHPEIKDWHDRIMAQLRLDRTVRNAFGYKMTYFERVDIRLRNQALAWIPQSTVAIATNTGLANIDENLSQYDVQLLLQVHDSLVGQVPTDNCEHLFNLVLKEMAVVIPYEDPLVIPNTLDVSEKSWGDVMPMDKWLKQAA